MQSVNSSGAMQRMISSGSDDYRSTFGENSSKIGQPQTGALKTNQSPTCNSNHNTSGVKPPMLKNHSIDSYLTDTNNANSGAHASNGPRLSIHGTVSDALLSAIGDITKTTGRSGLYKEYSFG